VLIVEYMYHPQRTWHQRAPRALTNCKVALLNANVNQIRAAAAGSGGASIASAVGTAASASATSVCTATPALDGASVCTATSAVAAGSRSEIDRRRAISSISSSWSSCMFVVW
jgi:hypothetical protein